MRNTGEMRILIIVGVLLIILAGTCAAASLSNSESGTWKYQREIAVQENSGETFRDYQVLVELSGSDFPGETQADGDDIRFTDADGADQTAGTSEPAGESTPGFAAMVAVIGLLLAYLQRKRR
ncbi:MAG: hypothetical protein CHKLHMKO_00364 [Candidatus Argoarchaeum ethanivorans]|uniref:PGF-CTERM archaeal protein-sorting signal domain-containing protein n=1 Tax=Candidatus Argoarchaeum ethanivorans TaxID=2608793 RepID=A0A811T6J9_9EURY|nr:MAG: hypothetical protein CHKLHMKO_00364 [Candidatus Argoarchaeum ethanivorans]